MKNKTGMSKLRRKIVITFLVITAATAGISSLLDFLIEKLEPFFTQSDTRMFTVVPIFFFLYIANYILAGFVFYFIVRKAIRKESERQVRENNLMYAAVAHDLKTPLTSIQGFSKALADDKIPEAEKNEIYDIISKKSTRMNDLVDLLFEYSQLGTAEYKPSLTDIDVAELMRGIIADNYNDLEEHGIDVDVHIPDSPIMINADKRDISRALSNLVINTYKHNPSGITFYIRVEREGDKCVITLADTGNEIPQGMDIFEPFVTENSARTTGGGTGLGLAITKRVIERHGGSITLTHKIPGYTKAFIVKLKCK